MYYIHNRKFMVMFRLLLSVLFVSIAFLSNGQERDNDLIVRVDSFIKTRYSHSDRADYILWLSLANKTSHPVYVQRPKDDNLRPCLNCLSADVSHDIIFMADVTVQPDTTGVENLCGGLRFNESMADIVAKANAGLYDQYILQLRKQNDALKKEVADGAYYFYLKQGKTIQIAMRVFGYVGPGTEFRNNGGQMELRDVALKLKIKNDIDSPAHDNNYSLGADKFKVYFIDN